MPDRRIEANRAKSGGRVPVAQVKLARKFPPSACPSVHFVDFPGPKPAASFHLTFCLSHRLQHDQDKQKRGDDGPSCRCCLGSHLRSGLLRANDVALDTGLA